jgi:prepilin-type N-terminal cleavage/methylation domain-containing protein
MIKSHNLRSQSGFTIVELLIVIVVIGILAALVLNTFSGVQARARDTERQTDTKALATQLEAYYNLDGQGKYPIRTNISTSTLKGLDAGALSAPGKDSSTLVDGASSSKDNYGYRCLDAAGAVKASPTNCEKFELSYTKENLTGTETNPIVIKSLN